MSLKHTHRPFPMTYAQETHSRVDQSEAEKQLRNLREFPRSGGPVHLRLQLTCSFDQRKHVVLQLIELPALVRRQR